MAASVHVGAPAVRQTPARWHFTFLRPLPLPGRESRPSIKTTPPARQWALSGQQDWALGSIGRRQTQTLSPVWYNTQRSVLNAAGGEDNYDRYKGKNNRENGCCCSLYGKSSRMCSSEETGFLQTTPADPCWSSWKLETFAGRQKPPGFDTGFFIEFLCSNRRSTAHSIWEN